MATTTFPSVGMVGRGGECWVLPGPPRYAKYDSTMPRSLDKALSQNCEQVHRPKQPCLSGGGSIRRNPPGAR